MYVGKAQKQVLAISTPIARVAGVKTSVERLLTAVVLAFSGLALLVQAVPTPVLAAGDVVAGRSIAHQHCARCHVVDEKNKFGGIGSTPSFKLLVTAFNDWRTRFKTFYARRPHPAVIAIKGRGRLREDLPSAAHPITIPVRAIDDILALAEDIKRSTEKP